VAEAIETMVVRGAPAIACAAAFGLAIDAHNASDLGVWRAYSQRFFQAIERMARTRPTAVNLFNALDRFGAVASSFKDDVPMANVAARIEGDAIALYDQDLAICKAIGEHGAALAFDKPVRVLTHCNTGSLATAGYGTALGIIRSLHAQKMLAHVYADETRPYLQGARLTAYELMSENIPVTLNVDSAAAYLMKNGEVDWVVVGADRVAANGDTANKIGTYSLAVNARHHGIPFYVAVPTSTFDTKIATGDQIHVEMRPSTEITHQFGKPVAPIGVNVVNPSFDVTPHDLISAIVTEKGVIYPPYKKSIAQLFSSQV